MDLQAEMRQLAELAAKRDAARTDYIKQVLLMAAALLGLLVSLHKTPTSSGIARIAFAVALVALLLGILCLSIALYVSVAVGKAQFAGLRAEVLSRMRGHPPQSISGRPSRFYEWMQWLGFVSLVFAVMIA